MTCASGEACGEAHAAEKCPWVLVTDAAEVKIGDTLLWPDVREPRAVVLGYASMPCQCGRVGVASFALSDDPPGIIYGNCLWCDIVDGRLYVLRDRSPDVESTDETQRPATKPRRLTTTNAGGKR